MTVRPKPLKNFSIFLGLLLCVCLKAGSGLAADWAEDAAFKADLNSALKMGGINVVAPASGIGRQTAAALYELAAKLRIDFPGEALSDKVPYNANTDETRKKLLSLALTDPQIRVIWAMRGGYGVSRLLDQLPAPPALSRKVFVGYSDMTFLHLFLSQAGLKSIHGAMFKELTEKDKDPENFHLLAGLLSGRLKKLSYEGLKPYNQAAREISRPIGASITGGNLTCLAAAAGTPWPLAASGKFLIIEDIEEPGMKIDRMLTQLQASGGLQGVEAVIIGSFTGGDANTEYALKRFAEASDFPVFKTDIFGHGRKNYPIVLNSPALISPQNGGNSFKLEIDATFP